MTTPTTMEQPVSRRAHRPSTPHLPVGPTRTRHTLFTLASLAGWAIVSFAVQWLFVTRITATRAAP